MTECKCLFSYCGACGHEGMCSSISAPGYLVGQAQKRRQTKKRKNYGNQNDRSVRQMVLVLL